jgi:hypothetical protein
MDGIENGIKRDPKRFFDFANYKRKTAFVNSVSISLKVSIMLIRPI